MSRLYRMELEVEDVDFDIYKPENDDMVATIIDAVTPLWNWESHTRYDGTLTMEGESSLCGGESEREFATRLAHAIWAATDRYYAVVVTATYLENPPWEAYSLDEDDWDEFRKVK